MQASRDALEADFCAFVTAQQARLTRFAWVLTLDLGAAEDLVQEALMRSWPRWETVRHGSPEAYVRKAIVNGALNRRRRKRVLEVGPVNEEPLLPFDDHAQIHTHRQAMRQALLSLPPRQRAALALRYLEDLTEVQTAAAMGCSIGTVKSTTHKALSKLRQDERLVLLRDDPGGTP